MFCHSLIIVSSVLLSCFQPEHDLPVFNCINKGDLECLSDYLDGRDVNQLYGYDSISLLTYSILAGQEKIVKFLLEKGANADLRYLGSPPLIHAVLQDNLKMLKQLAKSGADVNATGPKGNSVLMHAASRGDLQMVKYLVRKGAQINYRNDDGNRAREIAVQSNYPGVVEYLRRTWERKLPDMIDGPFVRWNRNDRIKSFYLVHDSGSRSTSKCGRVFHADSDLFVMKGYCNDPCSYTIRKNVFVPPAEVNNVTKSLVLGDMHGAYDSLLIFLKNNRIINDQHEWIWGTGHMVLLGDIFDRGDKVTEILWLIYHLDHQAREAGGFVHFILGNHEIMILKGQTDYIAEKYYYLSDRMNISYSWLFNHKTALGKWLRTRNTVMRINDRLYVHAGISPELANSGLSIDDINRMVRYMINHPDRHPYGEEIEELLLGSKGPFWYRGYFKDAGEHDQINSSDLQNIMSVYNIGSMMIGHTNVNAIAPLYDNKIYTLDVPFYSLDYPIQGILIEQDSIYLLDSRGERTVIVD